MDYGWQNLEQAVGNHSGCL